MFQSSYNVVLSAAVHSPHNAVSSAAVSVSTHSLPVRNCTNYFTHTLSYRVAHRLRLGCHHRVRHRAAGHTERGEGPGTEHLQYFPTATNHSKHSSCCNVPKILIQSTR